MDDLERSVAVLVKMAATGENLPTICHGLGSFVSELVNIQGITADEEKVMDRHLNTLLWHLLKACEESLQAQDCGSGPSTAATFSSMASLLEHAFELLRARHALHFTALNFLNRLVNLAFTAGVFDHLSSVAAEFDEPTPSDSADSHRQFSAMIAKHHQSHSHQSGHHHHHQSGVQQRRHSLATTLISLRGGSGGGGGSRAGGGDSTDGADGVVRGALQSDLGREAAGGHARLVSEGHLRKLVDTLDPNYDPHLLCLLLQALCCITLDPSFHESLLDLLITDNLLQLLLPSDEWYYTNHTTKYAPYVKFLATRMLVHLGQFHCLGGRFDLFNQQVFGHLWNPQRFPCQSSISSEDFFIEQMALGSSLYQIEDGCVRATALEGIVLMLT
uniref:Lysosomal trafficking regulator lyst n=1 Tax=Macrostomum lignano TaxID=282301 RepID=A0A1I8IX59_9PLAT